MKILNFSLAVFLIICLSSCGQQNEFRKISVEEYRSKMKAGWLGQMAGVGWGAPTEFRFNARIIPENEVPGWEPQMVNQHYQDDIYVEMTFLKTLEDYGFDVSIRQAGIDFANSKYQLWHANNFGRHNLRAGIAPPYSGHPKYNSHADDIDYQIEADFSGLIAPGMSQTVIELGEKFGRLMNYGDGLYGGQFVGAMYAEAFFETDIIKIIQVGLECIPAESQYAETIRDVVQWHSQNPDDWQKTWQLIENKYNLNQEYRKFSCSGPSEFNIDAKMNGAYIVLGLLYGKGDMDQTIIISMRGGQDSDCNPSNAAGVLATSLGLEKLPPKYKSNIDDTTKFSFTAYDFPSLLEVCEKLSRDAVVRAGGRVEKNSQGIEEYIIPIQNPVVASLKQCWAASEVKEDVNYSDEEMRKIRIKIRESEAFVTTWKVAGPFSKTGVKGIDLFDLEFGPENNKNYSEWEDIPVDIEGSNAGLVDLADFSDKENILAYLRTNVWINKDREVVFEIGSDDGVKVWVNGKLVHAHNIQRGHHQADDIAKVNLKKGWNSVLMKITQGRGGWGASLAIIDPDGKPVQGLKYSFNDNT